MCNVNVYKRTKSVPLQLALQYQKTRQALIVLPDMLSLDAFCTSSTKALSLKIEGIDLNQKSFLQPLSWNFSTKKNNIGSPASKFLRRLWLLPQMVPKFRSSQQASVIANQTRLLITPCALLLTLSAWDYRLRRMLSKATTGLAFSFQKSRSFSRCQT